MKGSEHIRDQSFFFEKLRTKDIDLNKQGIYTEDHRVIKIYTFEKENTCDLASTVEAKIELQILQRCQDIPNISRILDYEVYETYHFFGLCLVLEKYDHVKKSKFEDVVNSLEGSVLILNQRGIYHNDISPWNIMRNGNQYVLIDLNGATFGWMRRYSYILNQTFLPSPVSDLASLYIAAYILDKDGPFISKHTMQELKSGTISEHFCEERKNIIEEFYRNKNNLPWIPSGGKAAGIDVYDISFLDSRDHHAASL